MRFEFETVNKQQRQAFSVSMEYFVLKWLVRARATVFLFFFFQIPLRELLRCWRPVLSGRGR